jgi:TPR repeat protein
MVLGFALALALATRSEGRTSPSGDAVPSVAASVGRIDVKPGPRGLTIRINLSAPVMPTSDRVENPDRLVFDFPSSQLKGGNRHVPVNQGPIRELRLSQFSINPAVARIVVDLKERLDFQVNTVGNEVVIEILFPNGATATESSTALSVPAERQTAAQAGQPQKQPEPVPFGRERGRPPGAYDLMAKAKSLKIGDLQVLEEKADGGDPEAQTMFALAYHAGVLLRRDDAESILLLEKAAARNFAAAEESLGIFAQTGVGGPPDPANALVWYKKAVQHGSLDAATDIALIYANGNGVTKDSALAVSWFRKAAEGGDGSAQYNLALMYDRGEEVPRDRKESLHWLNAAADQNVIPAILDLGRLSLHPPDAGKPDAEQAVRYYTRAAELGSPLAQAILGNIYANGTQGQVDYEQSVKWYRKAAEQGQPEGQFGLGVRYALGQGVPMDLEEAHRLFSGAAAQGLADAQFDLATMYEEGKGSAVDTEQAVHYYQLSADQGFAPAQFRYGKFLARSTTSRDRVAAYKWLMLAQDSIKQSAAALSGLRSLMSDQEIAEAERRVDKWRVEHQPNPH